MRDAGVKIVAGSDVGLVMSRPAALLRELQLLADAGLPPGDVVVAASRHAAEKIGKGVVAGTIAPGRIADAVLVDANPLADIMHVIRPVHRIATLRRGRLAVAASAEFSG
jgi:imidazolonepropionase-like amidohydrolase